MILQTLFNLVLFITCASSIIIPNHFHFPDNFRKLETNIDISLTTAYLIQPLDHNSENSHLKFQQRYLYSEEFSTNKKVALLYVSGPDDFDSGIFKNDQSPFVKSAKEFGATIFALEHRFYRESKPDFGSFNSSTLQHLNSFQAIQDVIYFIEQANQKFQMDAEVRWILWGTGYGGLIATEARAWDPVTVSGVVSSSAPLRRELDFWKYNDAVEKAIRGIRGNSCAMNIKEGFRRIQRMMNSVVGRAQISDLFELNPSLNSMNLTNNEIQMFYLSIVAPFQQIVQFSDRFFISISDMCDIMHKSWNLVHGIHQVYGYLSKKMIGSYQPIQFSYEGYVNNLRNSSLDSPFAHQRLWQYQMCTEFGWFFTTNNNEDSIFGSVIPTSLFLNQCFDIFPELYINSNAIKIRDEIEAKQNARGNVSGTNMILINGEFDPWKPLGKESSDEFSVVTYTIRLGSHANEMNPRIHDFEDMGKVHEIIMTTINSWVKNPKNEMTFEDSPEPWNRPKVHREMSPNKRFSKLNSSKKKALESPNLNRMFFGIRPINSVYQDHSEDYFPKEGFEAGTFKQRVDHFDNTNTRFFQQKYFKSSKFSRPEGPYFLLIGPEAPLGERRLLSNQTEIMKKAEKFGATVYSLEHRFYGDSLVENNKDLTKLSSLQMLYDLAEFITSINMKTNTSNQWITFGGSYSGMLSAWMRFLFPELVVGAVASSAPVFAKTDFYEYHIVVENAYKKYDQECYDAIKNGFEEIHEKILSESGREELSELFQLTPPFGKNVSEIDKHFFYYSIVNAFDGAVQYSAGKNRSSFSDDSDIAMICNRMLNSTNPIENIAALFLKDIKETVEPWLPNNNYTFSIEFLKTSGRTNDSSMYLWLWQSCTEFGFFQTTDSGKSIFGTDGSVGLQIQTCMDLFGKELTREKVDEYVERSNYIYGGKDEFKGTNVIFTNGDADPWSALGLYNPSDKSVISHLIEGTSHCADFHADDGNDLPQLKYARKLVDEQIGLWLGVEETTVIKDTTEITTEMSTTISEETTTEKKSSVSKLSFVLIVLLTSAHCFIGML